VGRASALEPLGLGLDSRAEEALYRRNAGRVFGFCLAQLRRREDAEDALQTTFLHAMRSLRRGVVPLVESAWLLGIARNVCRERWEAAGRLSRLESSCDPQQLERVEPAPEGRRDELIGLEDALTRLPEQQRRAILLRDWRGLSYDEVATQLGVSHAAVETLIFRGRRTLAELLREEPQQTRRRLASLGNLGSLATAVKTALTGAAAATKLATAVAIVAVAGAGLAAGTPLVDGGQERSQRVAPQRLLGPAEPGSLLRAAVEPRRAAAPAAPKPVAARSPSPRRTVEVVPPQVSASVAETPVRAAVAEVALPDAPTATSVTGVTPPGPAAPTLSTLPAMPAAPAKPQPVQQVVDTVLPAVADPVTSLPLTDALAPPASPVTLVTAVTPPAVGAIVETVPTPPVDPPPVTPPLPVEAPPLPPVLP
jgi:RNA polymerase sigma-70 factor (ECF subfamily)